MSRNSRISHHSSLPNIGYFAIKSIHHGFNNGIRIPFLLFGERLRVVGAEIVHGAIGRQRAWVVGLERLVGNGKQPIEMPIHGTGERELGSVVLQPLEIIGKLRIVAHHQVRFVGAERSGVEQAALGERIGLADVVDDVVPLFEQEFDLAIGGYLFFLIPAAIGGGGFRNPGGGYRAGFKVFFLGRPPV